MIVPKKRPPVFFDRVNECFVFLNMGLVVTLREAFPTVDLQTELNKMKLWLLSSKGKNRKGNMAFIMTWLRNAEKEPIVKHITNTNGPLGDYYDNYLEDLWKNCHPVLEFNKIKR